MKLSVVFEYIDKASNAIQQTERHFKKFQKTISFTQSCLWKYNQTAELMGRAGEAIAQVTGPGMELNQAMADLSAITGIAGKDLERLEKVARRTGVSSGLGATGAANAFALLASQIDVSKIGMDGLIELQSKTITLAQASGMSMTEAANSMAGTINQFGLQASDASRVINVLAAGSKYGAAEIPQLAESFKVVGAAANAAGLSVESTAGAIEVLSKNNLKGAEAGTALRNIVLKMQTAMGVDFSKTSLQEALIKLKPHLKDAAYMSKLFGMENVAAAQFLVANTDLLGEMTARVTDTNVAQEQAVIRTSTWKEELKRWTARFNDWGISLTKLAPGVLSFIQVGSQLGAMGLAMAPIGKLLIGVGKGAFSAGSGIVHFGKVLRLLSIAKAAGSAELFARTVGRCGSMGRIAAGVLNGYQKAVTFCSLALKRATWSQMGHSVAVKASAFWSGICTKANLVASGVMSAWNTVTTAATWTELRKAAVTKLHTLWTLMSSKAMLIAGGVTAGWTKVTKVAAFVQGGLTKALRIARMVMMTSVLPALTGVIAATWAWTVALLANPITWIVLAVGALVAAIVVCWQKFAGFRAVLLTVKDTIKGFGEAVWNFLVAPWKSTLEMVSGVGKAIAALFSGGSWKDAGKKVSDGFSKSWDVWASGMKKAVNGVADTTMGISGNYEMHLTEERTKQAGKEKKSRTSEAEDGAGETGGAQTIQPVKVPDGSSRETPVVHAESSQKLTLPETPAVELSQYAEIPETVSAAREADRIQVARPEKVQDGSSQKMPVVNVENSKTPTLPEMSSVEQPQYVEMPEVMPATAEIADIQVIQPEKVQNSNSREIPAVNVESDPGLTIPEIKTVAPPIDFNSLSPVESQFSGTNLTNNYSQSANSNNRENQAAKVDIHFQPNINISAELTQKTREDFLGILRGFGDEITKMVEEVQRRNGRGAYAVS